MPCSYVTGYQAIIAFFFIVCLPLNIVLNSMAMSATMEILRRMDAALPASILGGEAAGQVSVAPASSSAAKVEAGPSTSEPSNSGSGMASVPTEAASTSSPPEATVVAAAAAAPEQQQGWSQRVAAMLGFEEGKPAETPSSSSDKAAAEAEVAAAALAQQAASVGVVAHLRAALSDILSVMPAVLGMLKRVW